MIFRPNISNKSCKGCSWEVDDRRSNDGWDDESLAIFRVNVMWRIKSRNFVWLGRSAGENCVGLRYFPLFGLLVDFATHAARGSTPYAVLDRECHPTGITLTLGLLAAGASHLGSWAPTQIQTHTTAFFFLGYWP
jgi:hypothetical protein